MGQCGFLADGHCAAGAEAFAAAAAGGPPSAHTAASHKPEAEAGQISKYGVGSQSCAYPFFASGFAPPLPFVTRRSWCTDLVLLNLAVQCVLISRARGSVGLPDAEKRFAIGGVL